MAKAIFVLVLDLAAGFKECSSGSDTAKSAVEYLVTPFFPHRTQRAVKCKYSLSVNYGEYIKLIPDTIELPCAGQNGIYVEEDGGRSGPFCGNKRMPAFISRDVKFDLHIIIDTPLRGARVKIGYKAVTSPKGPNVALRRGAKASSAKMPIAILKMAPDQGQGQLQQTNIQNIQNEILNSQQEKGAAGLQETAAAPNTRGLPPGRRGYDPHREWVSETYNPVNAERPKVLGTSTKKSGGVEFVLPVLFLMILVAILIAVIHKRRQNMKADLKQMEKSGMSGGGGNTMKKDFIPITGATMEKSEPTIEQINHVIEANQNAEKVEIAEKKEPKVISVPSNKYVKEKAVPPTPANTLAVPQQAAAAPSIVTAAATSKMEDKVSKKVVCAPTNKIEKKTVSTDSAISKDSQATTAPSIRSECPKPTRPHRNPVVRPTRKQNKSDEEDDDRPCY